MRVIVADDQVLVRAGIVAILEEIGGFSCVASPENANNCLAACASTPSDVLLLDLNMPGTKGLELLQKIRQSQPHIRVVILTSQTDAQVARQAIQMGAVGFVSKDFVVAELAMALNCVRDGRIYISPDVALASIQNPEPQTKLTSRQKDVLVCIAKGLANKEIARQLNISLKTVEYHRAEVIQRLDLHDVASLTRYALVHGLVD